MAIATISSVDQIIRDANSWSDFQETLSGLSKGVKGRTFERLVQLYLQTNPKYLTKVSDVWLLKEVPTSVKRHLNLPEPDRGIDLIAKTHSGEYWSIQAKYRTNPRSSLRMGGEGGIAMFTSLSFYTSRGISFGLICATTDRPLKNMDLIDDRVGFAGLSEWTGLDDDTGEGWERIRSKIQGSMRLPKKIDPYPFQKDCISETKIYCSKPDNTRGKIILPCGTGKSLLGYWISQELGAKNVLLVVPSLTLVSQILGTWTAQSVALGRN